MIDARELRIGNWVYHTNTFCRPEMQLDFTLMKLEFHNGEYSEFDPIPLTPEVLGKAGFEASPTLGEDYWYINESLCKGGWYKQFVYYIPYNNLSTYCGNVNLQSLHHLQNLYFALTGEELTVNL